MNTAAQMDRASRLFDEARKRLTLAEFDYWLCFVYGVVICSMNDRDLDLIEERIREKEKK